VLTTDEVYQPATAEQWEGVLVRVEDVTVTSAPDQYGQWKVDDGSGDAMVDDLGDYTYNPVVGDTLEYVIGVLSYSFDEYKIEPRDNDDIGGGGGGGPALTCYEVQGQQASSPYMGQTVSVTGIVTVGEGEYYGTYAAMADEGGGPWSGLILYGNDVTGIERGDSITITGQVDEYFGLTELKFPTSIVVHSSGHPLPDAEVLTTDEVYQPATAEQWEGVLVRVEDVTVTSEPNEYGEWQVDDGSGDAVVDDLGDYSYVPTLNDQLASVTGVLNYSFDEYKIEPRDDADIVE
jgi:predicted extracellular nuclease